MVYPTAVTVYRGDGEAGEPRRPWERRSGERHGRARLRSTLPAPRATPRSGRGDALRRERPQPRHGRRHATRAERRVGHRGERLAVLDDAAVLAAGQHDHAHDEVLAV